MLNFWSGGPRARLEALGQEYRHERRQIKMRLRQAPTEAERRQVAAEVEQLDSEYRRREAEVKRSLF